MASTPASILNHKTDKSGIPFDSVKGGTALGRLFRTTAPAHPIWPVLSARRRPAEVKAAESERRIEGAADFWLSHQSDYGKLSVRFDKRQRASS
ncbi:hypothetical protein NKJ74_31185 [Mesorhizobium sp. M0046]|uniref:hypothetical protein n=1 Tax=Mesorhizobium sp. M0046 TaxID=2956858 RepID=UPI0033368569